MSSNIRIEKVCQYCGEVFIAKTTVTKHCSDRCAKRAYKLRKKGEAIERSAKETQRVLNKSLIEIQEKDFLTVRDAAILLSSSRQTIYNLIARGTIKAVNLKERKTLIKRSEIDKLFQ